ncbi:MAG TPA: DegT/DnrJ/EryC1/StrS family aminotransferase [Acidimicrobiia bacterium]|nr:DegT/DnrJ/EryC1/StrS family aminotransferase [Acidimicrobiia bacterium]
MQIPLSQPDVSGNEERYVSEAVRSTWISSTGEFVDRFEREYAALCGTESSIAVCNGTVALHLALLALDVRPGDEVLVPSLTYVAVANAVRYVGAEPVFVDVDSATWCIDPARIEENVTPRTRGIIAVHNYGHPADMDAINELAGVHGLWVVEDAAEAHLAEYRGRVVGSLATIGTFSFYGNKIISSGEGGALTLSDRQLELRLRTLRGQGMDPKRRYYFPVTGYNFRLTNVACALLCAQMEHLDEMLEARQAIFARYREQLDGCEGLEFQPRAGWATPAPWLFNITIDARTFPTDAAGLRRALEVQGVETRPFFIPLHGLPPFRESARARGVDLPVTNRLGASGVSLPTFSQLRLEEVDRVCALVRQVRG